MFLRKYNMALMALDSLSVFSTSNNWTRINPMIDLIKFFCSDYYLLVEWVGVGLPFYICVVCDNIDWTFFHFLREIYWFQDCAIFANSNWKNPNDVCVTKTKIAV